MKRFIDIHNIAITAIVFVVMGALYLPLAHINLLKPIAQSFSDFDITDLYFSKLRDAAIITADTNIVLVNIGNGTRADIANEITALSRFQPAVIGVDVLFRKPKSASMDSMLEAACAFPRHLVFANSLKSYNAQIRQFDTIACSLPRFVTHGTQGFDNLVNESNLTTVREFSPQEVHGDSAVTAFAAAIVCDYDTAAYAHLAARKNPTELINFRGNTEKFLALDVADVLAPNADLAIVRNKIVLLGYLGPTLNAPTLEDIHYTPLNSNFAGKAYPDMYGVVIHANIISMILHGDYLGVMPLWLAIVLAIVLCHLHAVFYSWIDDRFSRWFDAIATVVQFTELIGVLFLIVIIFEWFSYRLDVTLPLIAMVLCGTVYEVYHSLIHSTFTAVRQKLFQKEK